MFDCTPATFLIDLEDKNLEYDLQEFIKYFQRFATSEEKMDQIMNKFGSLFRLNFSYRSNLKALTYKGAVSSKNPKIHNTYFRGANLWLLKPVDFNRGRGIELFSTLDGLKTILTNSKLSLKHISNTATMTIGSPKVTYGSGQKIKRFVLQKYIESPLLVNQRKFDIRVWVLVDQDLNLYFFKLNIK